jgi:hypothetical protein
MSLEITLTLRCYYLSNSTSGQHHDLFTKTTRLTLNDGYLDDATWQRALLDHCHAGHLWQSAKWAMTPHFEFYVDDVRVSAFSNGGLMKPPSIPQIVMNTTMAVMRLASKRLAAQAGGAK